MFTRIFALFGLAFVLFGTQCWAQTPGSCVDESNCFTFDTAHPSQTYRFDDGSTLTVQFDTVLRPFDLRVADVHFPGPTLGHPFDPRVFPPGTVCVKYSTGQCAEYNFTGNAKGPNGVPVKNKDYKGLITLTLVYDSSQTVHEPAFGHAPGDDSAAVYSEDILTSYSTYPPCPSSGDGTVPCENPLSPPTTTGDPTMKGTTPGISSVAALDKPGDTDCFFFVSPAEGQRFSAGQEIEVEFRLSTTFTPTCEVNPIRDKDARLSLSRVDGTQLVFVPLGKDEGGKHFHFDNESGVNEREVDTNNLQPGIYIITVFSDEFSPQSRTVCIQGPGFSCP